MARINNLFKENDNESVEVYDKRISTAEFQHIGYAFFERSNYDVKYHTFSVYIVWNDKINSIIEDPYPSTGFVIHCDEKIAECLAFEYSGQPVWGKFISCNKRVNITDLIIRFFDRNYVVSYTGCYTAIPENVYFMSTPDVNEDNFNRVFKKNDDANKVSLGSFNKGSFNNNFFNMSSFTKSSFYLNFFSNTSYRNSVLASSFNKGSFNVGSFNAGSFNIGAFNISSFNWGSFVFNNFNLGSFNHSSFNISSFNMSSFNKSLFNNSSYNMGSYITGSYKTNLSLITSFKSQNKFQNGSFNYLSNTSYNNMMNKNEQIGEMIFEDFLKEIFGIGFMGYGLNLI